MRGWLLALAGAAYRQPLSAELRTEAQIPERIFFCSVHPDDAAAVAALPAPRRAAYDAAVKANPASQVTHFSDAQCVQLVQAHFPAIAPKFRATAGSHRAHLCAAAYLAVHGGWYLGFETSLLGPLARAVPPQTALAVPTAPTTDPLGLLGAAPGHPVLAKLLERYQQPTLAVVEAKLKADDPDAAMMEPYPLDILEEEADAARRAARDAAEHPNKGALQLRDRTQALLEKALAYDSAKGPDGLPGLPPYENRCPHALETEVFSCNFWDVLATRARACGHEVHSQLAGALELCGTDARLLNRLAVDVAGGDHAAQCQDVDLRPVATGLPAAPASLLEAPIPCYVIAPPDLFAKQKPTLERLGLAPERLPPVVPKLTCFGNDPDATGSFLAHQQAWRKVRAAGRALVVEADATIGDEDPALVAKQLHMAYRLDKDYVSLGGCGRECTNAYFLSPAAAGQWLRMSDPLCEKAALGERVPDHGVHPDEGEDLFVDRWCRERDDRPCVWLPTADDSAKQLQDLFGDSTFRQDRKTISGVHDGDNNVHAKAQYLATVGAVVATAEDQAENRQSFGIVADAGDKDALAIEHRGCTSPTFARAFTGRVAVGAEGSLVEEARAVVALVDAGASAQANATQLAAASLQAQGAAVRVRVPPGQGAPAEYAPVSGPLLALASAVVADPAVAEDELLVLADAGVVYRRGVVDRLRIAHESFAGSVVAMCAPVARGVNGFALAKRTLRRLLSQPAPTACASMGPLVQARAEQLGVGVVGVQFPLPDQLDALHFPGLCSMERDQSAAERVAHAAQVSEPTPGVPDADADAAAACRAAVLR